ncbi:S26 family signal peptidase [Streptomyces sp. NPDC057654]|uniref:S26 family signal peptidase n=1 Tax=Streptomyces sp. NPDC057654 TaxID=3346196 RepID=UPI00369FF14D
MSPVSGAPRPSAVPQQLTRAETAVGRARARARSARAHRITLYAAVVSCWAGAAALAVATGRPAWGMAGSVPALVVTAVLAAVRAAERRLVSVDVSGDSMEPAFHEGDRVLAHRRTVPTRGAVVVVERPPYRAPWPDAPVARTAPAHVICARHWFIKRVAAVPGDPVPRTEVPALAGAPEATVPEGMLVLLGDNRDRSYDSRSVGYFPASRVLGTVEEPDPSACPPRSAVRMRKT